MADPVVTALSKERLKIGIEEMKARHGAPPWHEVLTENDRYRVVAICQAPGHPNDWHYHLSDECWFIYEGELSWTMEGESEPIHVTSLAFARSAIDGQRMTESRVGVWICKRPTAP